MDRQLLLTSAGTGASNNLVRSLRAGDPSFVIVGCHDDRFILKRSTAERQYLVPPPIHHEFLPALRRVIETERIDLIVPVTDDDVRLVSRLRHRLPTRVFLPRPQTIARCQDKYALSALLQARGVAVPFTLPITNAASVAAIFRKLPRGQPAWCRIRRGSGAIGAVRVNTPEQVVNWIRCWQALRRVAARSFTLSEYLPGRDFTCQSVWREGTLILVKTAERLSYLGTGGQPGVVSSVATLAKTVDVPAVVATCVQAVRALDAHASGAFSIDLRENARGVPCITEINAGRFSSGTNLLDLTGKHNMAVIYARLGMGETVDLRETYDTVEDHYMLRDVDVVPTVHHADAFFEDIREIWGASRRRAARHTPPTKERRHGLDIAAEATAEASDLS